MAKSKHSAEKVINLGKNLIEELNLEYTTNTLARWMVHYLAEMIDTAENTSTTEEKTTAMEEICETILKIWSLREKLPIRQPIVEVQPLLLMLRDLNLKPDYYFPSLYNYRNIRHNDKWHGFVDLVKNNSEQLLWLAINTSFSSKTIAESTKFHKDNSDFLSDEENEIIEYIEFIASQFPGDFNTKSENTIIEELPVENRYKLIFEDMERLLDQQKAGLLELKKHFIS